MVDALKEIHRVLPPGGTLLDLRPLPTNWRLEVVTPDEMCFAGSVDNTSTLPDTAAVNKALEHALSAEWFEVVQRTSFDLFSYFDTPEALMEHAKENWTSSFIPIPVYERMGQIFGSNPMQSSIRMHYPMTIGQYRKT